MLRRSAELTLRRGIAHIPSHPAILTFLLASLGAGCSDSATKTDESPQPGPYKKTLSFGFESALADWEALGGAFERALITDIDTTSDTRSEGVRSCRFTVSPSSVVGGRNRAELTFDQGATEGVESWVEFDLFVPKDFHDAALYDSAGRSNWQIISQWHQQPVKEDGETWETYPAMDLSPPISVSYGFLSKSDSGYRRILKDPSTKLIPGFDSTWNDESVLSISYASRTIALARIAKGQWVRLRLHIRWSEHSDGFLQAWIDSASFTEGKVYGPNMLNRASHYFKFGLYRSMSITSTNSLYFDRIHIW